MESSHEHVYMNDKSDPGVRYERYYSMKSYILRDALTHRSNVKLTLILRQTREVSMLHL